MESGGTHAPARPDRVYLRRFFSSLPNVARSGQRLRGNRFLLRRGRERLDTLLSAVGLIGILGDLEGDLEAEVLLGGAVERLLVAEPQRIEGRVGGELGRRPLAQHALVRPRRYDKG